MSVEKANLKTLVKLLGVETAEDLLTVLTSSDLGVESPFDIDLDSINEEEKQEMLEMLNPQVAVIKQVLVSQSIEESKKVILNKLNNLEKSLDFRTSLGVSNDKEIQFTFYKELQEVGFTEKQAVFLLKKVKLTKMLLDNTNKDMRFSELLDGLNEKELNALDSFISPMTLSTLKAIKEHGILTKLAQYLKLNYDAGIKAGFTPTLSLEMIDVDVEKI